VRKTKIETYKYNNMSKIKAFFKGIWQFVSYLFVPQSGSKRRAEQQAYEERLEAANKRLMRSVWVRGE